MVYSEGYAGGFGGGNSRGSSPIPIVRLGARLNEPGDSKDNGGAEEKANVEETSPPRESEPCVVEEKREGVEEPAKDEGDFVPVDDELEAVGVVEVAKKVDEEDQSHDQAESAAAASEPEEKSLQPSSEQPRPEAETISAEETVPTTVEGTVGSVEPEKASGQVSETAEKPEQGQEQINEESTEPSVGDAADSPSSEAGPSPGVEKEFGEYDEAELQIEVDADTINLEFEEAFAALGREREAGLEDSD